MMMFSAFIAFTGSLFCGVLAVFVLSRNAHSFAHRTFALGMIALGIMEIFIGQEIRAASLLQVIYWERLRILVSAFLPGSWLLFSLSFARSNYKELVARWKWLVLGSFAGLFSLAALFKNAFFMALSESDLSSSTTIPLGWSGYTFQIIFLLTSLMILVNLEETLRASTGNKRWRIKFMILGLGGLFAVQIYTISQTLLFSSVNLSLDVVNSYAIIVADILIVLSLSRNRLFDVEIYISRAFLYNSITIMAIGIYLLVVGSLAKVIRYVGGAQLFPFGTFFVFISLLVLTIVLLSDQLRQAIKQFISRNFYRHQYDYRQEWMAFTRRTTSLVNIEELCAAVSKMISETFGVPSVTVWLLSEKMDEVSLGGSTALSGIHHVSPSSPGKTFKLFLDIIRDRQIPFDFNSATDPRIKELKQIDPDYLVGGRIRYCAPLIAGQQLLGWMTLNERLSGELFLVEDLDLLKTIADQVAGSLLNLKLSDRLLKAKEMEAFQTLSAFFIHDLKNLASTLSLTMQNLPTHFENPEFRSDAMEVFSHSVAKMNDMCSRLSTLTKKMELQKANKNLNELVEETLGRMNGSLKATLAKDLRPLPNLLLDPEQIEKVLFNLILNASEAMDANGEIHIETNEIDGWVVLSIRDNGCGMPKDFIARSLFQPFQTTKSKGLGIGLFHSKKIIEAHHGKIEVESEEGVGTTFRIALPLE